MICPPVLNQDAAASQERVGQGKEKQSNVRQPIANFV